MAFDEQRRTVIHDVTSLGLTCSECGTAINELPFMPNKRSDGTYGRIYCRDCNRKRREQSFNR